jgi:hypothetical protein
MLRFWSASSIFQQACAPPAHFTKFRRKKNMSRRLFQIVAVVAVLVGLAPQARAGFVMTIEQEGSNVFATGSGTINLSALTTNSTDNQPAFVDAYFAVAAVGVLMGTKPFYQTPTSQFNGGGPQNFGSTYGINATSATGDIVEIEGQFGNLAVPTGYVSGAPLSGTATWDNTTISGLGLIPGSYTWSWGTGPTLDSFTVNIVSPVPEPSSLILGGLGAVGLLTLARRRRTSAAAERPNWRDAPAGRAVGWRAEKCLSFKQRSMSDRAALFARP